MSKWYGEIAAVCVAMAAIGHAAQPANTSWPCRSWIDPVLHVKFPERLGGLEMSGRRIYNSGDDDYSLRYDSSESRGSASGGKHLDVYIYTRDGKPTVDGAGDEAMEEIRQVGDMLRLYGDAKSSWIFTEGKLSGTGLKYLWMAHTFKFADHPNSHQSVTLVTAWRKRFIKIRYSEPILSGRIAPCEELPAGLLSILADIDALFAGAIAAGKVDVYAIADPAEALSALRQKWLGSDTRVSMADMPDYEDKFFELDETQDWCNDDMDRRADVFEDVSREGVRLRIEPQIWHYNLACALARQRKKEDAFSALEQAIAAGFNRASHMEDDADLESLRNDGRFAKLMVMARTIKTHWNAPRETANVMGGKLSLDENNVYYSFNDWSYLVKVEADATDQIVYLDHSREHQPPPAEDMIDVEFAEPFHDAGRDTGAANIHFVNSRTWACMPTVLQCNAAYGDNLFCASQGIPAEFPLYLANYRRGAQREARHFAMWNTLGIYTAADDYGKDGIDRFAGHFPACVAYTGDKEDGDGFVRLYRDIVLALPLKHRGVESQLALNVIRHAQKCVTNESAFMSGIAQRPVLSFGDIDCARAVADARAMWENDRPPPIPFIKDFLLGFVPMRTNDILEGDCNRLVLSQSAYHRCLVASWGDKTAEFELEMQSLKDFVKNEFCIQALKDRVEKGLIDPGYRYEWRVLQGDSRKVRIVAKDKSAEKVRMEIDYHEVFDVPLANGKTVKSSRVDVGCFFLNAEGRASVPAIVSVYFNPNETREYGADGKLLSIDYSKRQLDGWRPRICAKGNWKDVFRYTADGEPNGWTRYAPNRDGSVTTNEYTRDGLVVMTRDELGRPKDARRDMKMEWTQDFEGKSFDGREYGVHLAARGIKYDRDNRHPATTALSWQYTYKGDGDIFGEASPKPFKPFVYKPDMNKRAAFTEASGFRLPLVDQMMDGNVRYVGYKYGRPAEYNANDLARADSPLALKEKGLTPPKELRKMEFCPWKPSTNDMWVVDADDFEAEFLTNIVELADCAYRLKRRDMGETNAVFCSVRDTYWIVNGICEERAYTKLDKTYVRVPKFDTGDRFTVMTDGAPLRKEDLPDGVEVAVAAWELSDGAWFAIKAFHYSDVAKRAYLFVKKDDTDELGEINFSELPSRAIGNTVLRTFAGESDALNNLAVLLYAEVANPGNYDESLVVGLLERAAKKGNAAAKRNLEVLNWNRGRKGGE